MSAAQYVSVQCLRVTDTEVDLESTGVELLEVLLSDYHTDVVDRDDADDCTMDVLNMAHAVICTFPIVTDLDDPDGFRDETIELTESAGFNANWTANDTVKFTQ